VLDGIAERLGLEGSAMDPSRAVLYDYGNVSSSSTWYTLAYIESCRGVRKGDRVMQVRGEVGGRDAANQSARRVL
jgi:3-ketoacyl-CoA synthase